MVIDSKIQTLEAPSYVYVTSDPDDPTAESWGQPPASHHVLTTVGDHMSGHLLEGYYISIRKEESIESVPGLAEEISAWDAASDEALTGFEEGLD